MAVNPGTAVEPWAATAQQLHTAEDDALTLLGRRLHPTCVWWWGRDFLGSSTVARCYVCGHLFAAWRSTLGLSRANRATIQRHRRDHLPMVTVSIMGMEDHR